MNERLAIQPLSQRTGRGLADTQRARVEGKKDKGAEALGACVSSLWMLASTAVGP